MDWRSNVATYERPVQPITIIPDVKLGGTSVYRENFRRLSMDRGKEKESSGVVTQKPKE